MSKISVTTENGVNITVTPRAPRPILIKKPGVQGIKGDKGDQGEAATIEVGTVTTVAPDDPAAVTNVGTPQEAVFDFSIPRGQPGVVQAVVAGTNVTVNNADPANPVVNASGSVSSVAMTVPTGLSVSGSPITTSGTFALSYESGYQGYTTTEASKLSGIEAGAKVNVNADWNAVSGDAAILNKPALATVATTGAYSDLSGTPTLSAVATSGEAEDVTYDPTSSGLSATDVQGAIDELAGENLRDAESVAMAELANIPASVNYIRTAGYAVAGDGGGALYKRAVTEPDHPGKFQSADGAWWEICNEGAYVPLAFPAVHRPLWAKFGDTLSALDAGCKNDATDTTDELAALMDYCAANTCEVNFPAGRYLVTEALSVEVVPDRSIVWRGQGTGNTNIELNTGGDGLQFVLPGNWWLDGVSPGRTGFEISSMTFTTTNAHAGKGLSIVGNCLQGRPAPRIILDKIEMRAKSSLGGQGFADWLHILDAGEVSMIHPRIMMANGAAGTRGIVVAGTAQANSPTVVNLDHPVIYYGDVQIEGGDYLEGLYVTQPTLVAGNVGIKYRPAVGESGFHLIGGHISARQYNCDLENLFDWSAVGTLHYRSGGLSNYSAIITRAGGRFNIANNVFKGSNTGGDETGVQVFSSVAAEHFGGVITGNSFHSFSGRGIWLAVNAEYVRIPATNSFRQCAVRILHQAANPTNFISPNMYGGTTVVPLTGGAVTENVDLPLPTGAFPIKPGFGFLTGDGNDIVGTYDFTNSTLTTARFVLRRIGGSNLAAGNARLNWCVGQSLFAGAL